MDPVFPFFFGIGRELQCHIVVSFRSVSSFSHLESFVFSFITVFRVIFDFNFEFSSSIFFNFICFRFCPF